MSNNNTPQDNQQQGLAINSQTDQRLNHLDSRMERMATSLETLIGIVKATEPPQPVQPTLRFDPVSTAPTATNPNFAQFAFVTPGGLHPAQQQQPPGGLHPPQQQQPAPTAHQQQQTEVPRQFPSHEHPPNGQDTQGPVYLEPAKLPEVWFSGETRQLAPFLRVIQDFLYIRQAFFSSQPRMIVWILRHFGF
ncbi:hypothetical protein PGTUg99_022001 [Puccinia graminis f. sp. tritici]|uniref:Uncharacterized protein n=1 Tax=Puccinia graminis f. sp. tritici TaxID=56615 RepID=A0A5B0QKI5_PUCGR|nr:hypothetical protein PGTUg99_022001 [Puccinia graminis f. sp. tritici]